ncbi:unnamed protein product [Ilex paraguariensis]|uniref:Embryo surrounding factor 1 brassicaceae domain-containing protein n=1 Tax=Ilex paraguariensis TaxID=185542 RepID=A0ABC8SB58_9AQUA
MRLSGSDDTIGERRDVQTEGSDVSNVGAAEDNIVDIFLCIKHTCHEGSSEIDCWCCYTGEKKQQSDCWFTIYSCRAKCRARPFPAIP